MNLLDGHFPPQVFCFFSERPADFALRELSHRLPPEQTKALAAQTGLELPAIFNIKQVHAAEVVDVTSCGKDAPVPEADALVTSRKNQPLAIRTADCLPVFLVDPKTGALGLAHAGWRSTRAGIVGRTVRLLETRFGVRPPDLLVGFGPCIRSCCYEVGEEVRAAFAQTVTGRGGKFYADLSGENLRQLKEAGVREEAVRDAGLCTCCDKRFFSFRREGDQAGRHLSLLMVRVR